MTPTTRLLLIRHGETAWNAQGRIQGQLDVPLSSRGHWQAGRLAQHLLSRRPVEPIHALIASPLARAWLTAQPIAQALDLEPQAEPRLRERHFGVFQGHTLQDAAARWPEAFAQWRARDVHWPVPEGESAQQFIARTLDALTDIAQQWSGKTVALVVHGGVLDVAYRHAQGMVWDAPRLHMMLNAAINRMQATTAPWSLQVLEWGDVSHLEGDTHGPSLEGNAP